MNTLSRIDALFTTFLSNPPSSSAPPPTPPSESKGFHPIPSPSRPVGTLSPPTSSSRRRRSLRRRRKSTSASIKLPPPSTPFFLRIALGLWSILLSFWVSLVGETRAERGRRRKRREVGKGKVGVSSDEGSGTDEIEQEINGAGAQEGEEGTEGEDGWVDPVTRAPQIGQEGEMEEDYELEVSARQSFSFRLPSAEKRDEESTNGSLGGIDVKLNPPTPEKNYDLRSSAPTGILSNPLPTASRARVNGTPTPPRSARLLPNPMITSLLDPSVPLGARQPPKVPVPAPHIRPHHTPFHLQKTLILDLDETLIHSTSRPLGYSTSAGGGMLGISLGGLLGGRKSRSHGHTVEVVLRGRSTTYHVYKRPYVDLFLKKVASWYTLVIYTASMPEYADPVIDWLDAGRSLFAKRLYRDSCFLQNNGSYIKDLALVEKDLARVCFMDNSPISYAWNKANALPIEGWTSDPNDEALLQSLPVLDCLRFVNDVRRVLGIRGFS